MRIPSRFLSPSFSFLLLVLASLTCALPSRCQTPPPDPSPATNTGTNPYETYGGEHENINFGTGNVNIPLTLLRLPGRDGHDLVVQMAFDSRVWQLHGYFDQGLSEWVLDWEKDGGWSSIFPQFSFDSISGPSGSACNGNYRLALPDGSKLSFPNVRNQCNLNGKSYPAGWSLVGDARGVSYSRLSVPGPTVGETLILKDGSKLLFNGVYITGAEDSNGNTISYSGVGGTSATITDTVGHVVTVTPNSSGNPTSIQYKDSNGQTQTITFNYSNFTIAPSFSQPTSIFGSTVVTPPYPNCTSTQPCTWALISSIVLPNGLSWTFQYNAWGEVTKITYPTGGYTRYEYGVFTGSGPGGNPQDFREVTAKHACTSYTGTCTVEDTTTYTPTINNTLQNNQYMDVTDPLGNLTHYEFSVGGAKYFSPREINRSIYQGSTTLLKTIHTDYNNLDSFGHTQDISLPIRVTTTLNDANLANKVEHDYAAYSSYGPINPTIDNVTEQRDYDWGSGAPGALLRKTDNSWLTTNPVNNQDYTATAIHILNRKSSVIVYNGAGTQIAKTLYEYDSYTAGIAASNATQHDQTFTTSYTTRGNQTAVQNWRNTDGALLTTRRQFDDAGNTLSSTDPLNHTTTYSYADSWANTACVPASGNAAAYLTKVTNALNQATNSTFNSCSGTPASTKDPNNLVTSFSYDLLNRLTQKNNPDGGQISLSYNDVPPVSNTTTTKINSTQSAVTTRVFDGLGRPKQSQLTSDPQGTVYTDTTYDALGRVATVSNPYRQGNDPTSTPGITTYAYDAFGRKTSETSPDNSILKTAYCGSSTLVTDPTGKWRRSRTDGLGRLVEVDEPNSTSATVASTGCPGTGEPIWVTSYGYDALGNLTSVLQNGSHQRNFTYNSLSQLLTSANPEVGTITYTYNTDGTLLTKNDARNITTTYTYDAIRREKTVAYSNGDPGISINYDEANCLGLSACQNIGQRTSMSDAAGSESWSYQVDATNKRTVHANQRTTTSTPTNITKTSTYYLDLAGNLTSVIYPTGRTVNYTYDGADRPSTAVDGSNGITYATDFQTAPTGCLTGKVCYTPQGTFYALSIGQTSSFSGLNLTHSYNSRLQPNEFKASSSGGNAIDITYNFVDPVTTHNSGHVYGITNNLDTTRSQTFTYDQLNRIVTALTTSTHASSPAHCWGETFSLDAWGNLQSIAATTNTGYTGCTQESGFSKTPDGNNHLSGLSYDLSGNTTNDGVNSYTWDGESQLKSAGGVTYAYDGNGRRAAKVGSKLYWYGSGGDILAETDASGNTAAEYIFFGGKRVAMLPASSTPIYYVEDLLGSSRAITSNTGGVCYDADFYPYGGERTVTNTCPQNVYKFEGKERDTETGNDDFGARYYSNRFGRWLSADWSSVPIAIPYANLTNPQTLNLYAMVADDPESFADLDGHQETAPSANGNTSTQVPCSGGGVLNGGCAGGGVTNDSGAATPAQANAANTPPPQEQSSVAQDIKDTAAGAISAWAKDNGAAGPVQGNELGQAIGHIGALVQGMFEMVQGGTAALAGGTEALVTAPAAATGVGAVIPGAGVGVAVLGVAEAAHGAAVFGNTLSNIHAASEHKTGERESTRGKHEEGQARRQRDQGGTKADKRLGRVPRNRPPGHKGPWPPPGTFAQ